MTSVSNALLRDALRKVADRLKETWDEDCDDAMRQIRVNDSIEALEILLRALEPREEALEEQLLLAVDIVVERRLGHLGVPNDLMHGRGRIAGMREPLERGAQNLLAGLAVRTGFSHVPTER